jgi:hypothetical protein
MQPKGVKVKMKVQIKKWFKLMRGVAAKTCKNKWGVKQGLCVFASTNMFLMLHMPLMFHKCQRAKLLGPVRLCQRHRNLNVTSGSGACCTLICSYQSGIRKVYVN